MYRFIASCLSILVAVASMPAPAVAAPVVPLSAPTAVLLDANSNRLVYSKNSHVKRKPASTTKILTAIVTVERLDLNKVVTVPKSATLAQPSKLYLKPGERYYVKDLLHALLLKSANDVAETLAVAVGGSKAGFAKMMNSKVRRIGAKNSNFVNPHGLPASGQYSTAYDLALIMREAQKYPFLVEVMKKRTYRIRSLNGRRFYLKNHNKMLWRDSREIVGKTGWTRRAKHCFAGRIRVNGKKVFIVVLGSHSLWRDLKRLVDYRFGSISNIIRANKKLWSKRDTRRIQTALKRSGFSPGTIDGVFGSKTVGAVKRFQTKNGLKADGIVGKRTWAKLKKYA